MRHLHLSQAVQRQEGMPLDLRDAVALGDLAVAQTHGSGLTHESLRSRSEYGNFLNNHSKSRNPFFVFLIGQEFVWGSL